MTNLSKRKPHIIISLVIVALGTLLNLNLRDGYNIRVLDSLDVGPIASTLAERLGEGSRGQVKAINITEIFTVIEHSAKLQLQGEVDFLGMPGDTLWVQYRDGAWYEIARYLEE